MKRSADVAFAMPVLEYKGFLYATLDFTDADDLKSNDQKVFKSLAPGWELVPEEQDIIENVVGKFSWGTSALVLTTGNSYCTNNCMGRSGLVVTDALMHKDGRYKPNINGHFFMRVLARCPLSKRETQSKVQLGGRLWTSRRFTDVTVRSDGKEFHCHCAVLCDASKVFERMFASDFQEKTSRIVDIFDAKPCVVEEMLSFIYTGELKEDFPDLVELAVLADRYALESLLLACAKPLYDKLSISTAPRVIRAFKIFKDQPEPLGSIWDRLQQRVAADPAICSAVMAEV